MSDGTAGGTSPGPGLPPAPGVGWEQLAQALQLVTGELEEHRLHRRILGAARALVSATESGLALRGPGGLVAQAVMPSAPPHSGAGGEPGSSAVDGRQQPHGERDAGGPAVAGDPDLATRAAVPAGVPADVQAVVTGDDRASQPRGDPRAPQGAPAGEGAVIVLPVPVAGEQPWLLWLRRPMPFTAAEQQLLSALAATAAVALDHARRHAEACARAAWLQAAGELAHRLLDEAPGDPWSVLSAVCEQAIALADGHLTAVLTADAARPSAVAPASGTLGDAVGDEDDLVVAAAADRLAGGRPTGPGQPTDPADVPVAAGLAGRRLSRASLSGWVLRTGRAVHARGPVDRVLPWPPGGTSRSPDGAFLAVPLTGGRLRGVFVAVRGPQARPFTAADTDNAAAFAGQLGLAFELAAARAEQQRLALLADRQWVAADLHDHVIQRLFAAGLTLQRLTGALPAGASRDRLQAVVDLLDDTIAQIRDTIHQLKRPIDGGRAADGPAEGEALSDRLMALLAEQRPALGFDPDLHLSGLTGHRIAPDLADDVLAVVREALSNVVRHAHAQAAAVSVTATDTAVTVTVADNGRGPGNSTRRSGLANLQRRADAHGGDCTLHPATPTGSLLTWTAPNVSQPDAAGSAVPMRSESGGTPASPTGASDAALPRASGDPADDS